MNQARRHFAIGLALSGAFGISGSAVAKGKAHHHDGSKLLGGKLKTKGKHVIDKKGPHTVSLDVTHWAQLQRAVSAGTTTLKDATASMPRLARVGGACPCANSVRWVMELDAPARGAGATPLHP